MKNQITNNKKELLLPAISGSYSLSFAEILYASFGNNIAFFTINNGSTHRMLLKNVDIQVCDKQDGQEISSFIKVYRAKVATTTGEGSITPTKKDSLYPNSKITESIYETVEPAGLVFTGLENQVPLFSALFNRSLPGNVSHFNYKPSKSFDIKDHFVINADESLIFRTGDDLPVALSDQASIAILVEWDEIEIDQ